MGALINRFRTIAAYRSEIASFGAFADEGLKYGDALLILDGVGGMLIAPRMARAALRLAGMEIRTIIHDWHRGPRGEILNDLTCLKKNRLAGFQVARKIKSLHRENPRRKLHVLAFSGGCGVSAFGIEGLKRDDLIDTWMLFCPAVSPRFNLGPALRNVRRCYAGTSPRDAVILGLGTALFGTTDRVYCRAAGLQGFYRPPEVSNEGRTAYQKLRQFRWKSSWRVDSHYGGHMDWASLPFLRKHLAPLISDEPLLDYTVGWETD